MPLFLPPPPQPLIVSNDSVSNNANATTVFTALTVYLWEFDLAVATTFSGAKWRVGTTATGSTDIGIYTYAGALQANLGGVVNTTSTNMTANFSGGNITLPSGQYFMAFSASNATDTMGGLTIGSSSISSHARQATNAATIPSTVVVLPATTGGFGITTQKFPGFSLNVVGGL